ncbi:hypothetical protein CI102_3665 [Trichoderma harzianum]|nr:hypothetical protein CI102_3665 [Trichoderma harzianum]
MLLLTDLSFNSWTGECLEQAGFLVSLLFWLGDYLLLLSSAAPPPLLCVLDTQAVQSSSLQSLPLAPWFLSHTTRVRLVSSAAFSGSSLAATQPGPGILIDDRSNCVCLHIC